MNYGLRARPILWLPLGILVALTAWLYMVRLFLPWENYSHVEVGTLKANLGDLYSPWFGTRALLLQKKNPYGPEVTRDIQIAFYGHPVVQNYASGMKLIDEQRFAYPVYLVFLLAPTVDMTFEMLHAAAGIILGATVVIAVLVWRSALRWRLSVAMSLAITLFILASPQIVVGLRLRQIGLIVGCFLALGSWLVIRNHLATAGAVLALSTVKPQMVALPIAWFLLWSLADLRKRWRLLAGFTLALALLIGLGELILPGWHRDFLAGLAAYRHYGPANISLLQVLLGNSLGIAIGIVLVVAVLAWSWKKNCQYGAESERFLLLLSGVFIVTALAAPLMVPFNQVLLILPVLIVLRDWKSLPRIGRVLFAVLVGWPCIVSLFLLAFAPPANSAGQLLLLPSVLVFFMPFLLSVLLMQRVKSAATAR